MFNRWIEKDLLGVLDQEGMGCIVFSPLAQGLLAGKYLSGIPADSRAGKPHGFLRPNHITEDKLRKVQALRPLAEARGQTLAQLALAWVLRHPGVTSALVGANTVTQLENNVATLSNLQFSPEELTSIETILAS
jgi:L-glyceraldehyde 3-phosphate reductase